MKELKCVICGETGRMKKDKATDEDVFVPFKVSRDPHKGYRMTKMDGEMRLICEDCFSKNFSNTVLEYGCNAEVYGGFEGVEYAIDTLRLKNNLWNKLVEIDRWNRSEFRR